MAASELIQVARSRKEVRRTPADPFHAGPGRSDIFSPFKVLTYPEALVAVRNDAPLKPINLEINPTNVCNQSCTWCTYGYLHGRRELLDPEIIVKALVDARELGVESVTWTGGGEPTVYEHLPRVVAAAVELGFGQGLNTNGSRLRPDLARALVDHFTYVRFSVDAGTAETYARTHRVRPGAFAGVTSAIRDLVRTREASRSSLTVGFSFLVDRSNVGDLLTAARLAHALGVDYFQIKPIVHYVESNGQFGEGSALWHEMERQLDDIRGLEDDRFTVRFLGHKFRDIRQQDELFGRTYDRCRGNELLGTVGADGSVDVCCAYKGQPDWSFGNLNERPLAEIWDGEQRREVLSRIDVSRCPPLCKAHEINKVFHYVRSFDAHREFV